MSAGDEKIRREILKWLYDRFEESPTGRWRPDGFFEALDDFDADDVVYNVKRLDGSLLENNPSLGNSVDMLQITPEGIEELYQQGYPTILDGESRYGILQVLYQADRQNPGQAYVSRDEVVDQVDEDADDVDLNVWYLKEKRLVEPLGGGGGLFYHQVKITRRGSERFEQYEADGVEIPRVGGQSTLRQASIGPNESGKAENLFRDFVELAREEVIVIDRYAREGLYDLLRHVPSGVEIQVMTSDRVTGGGYPQRVQQFAQQHSAIEVRSLADSDWEFHDRYIIRDREDAWAWGHSFHDAGDTQHTASELKPINRETIINQFDSAWSQGTVIQ